VPGVLAPYPPCRSPFIPDFARPAADVTRELVPNVGAHEKGDREKSTALQRSCPVIEGFCRTRKLTSTPLS
jgi:hypothetical protein